MRRFLSVKESKIIGFGKWFEVVINAKDELPRTGEVVEVNGIPYRVNEVQVNMLLVHPPKRSPVVNLIVTNCTKANDE